MDRTVGVSITATFSDGRVRQWSSRVAPGEPWGLKLADLFPAFEQEQMARDGYIANARAQITCDGPCSATVANWYGPIELGRQPSIYPVTFQCR